MSEENVDTTIGSNVKMEGNLKNAGSISVNGGVTGEIHSDENVIVGETATIKGPIFAKNVTVSGLVEGPIDATERLELRETAKVNGDVTMTQLIIQQGAAFNGKSVMRQTEGSAPTPASALPTPPRRKNTDEALTVLLGEEEEEGEKVDVEES